MSTVLRGDAMHLPLADESVQCVVTSPPYWGLRQYSGIAPSVWGGDEDCEHEWDAVTYRRRSNDGGDNGRKQTTNPGSLGRDVPIEHATCTRCGVWYGCLGLEPTPEAYVANMVAVFREVWRVLRKDGVVFLNLGDSYAGAGAGGGGNRKGNEHGHHDALVEIGVRGHVSPGLKPKDLVGIPWRVAFALQADGWWLRSDIIWAKGISFCKEYAGSSMPESVQDRPSSAHEHVFLLTKSAKYYYDIESVKEPCAVDVGNAQIRFGGSKYGDSDDYPTKSGNVYEQQPTRNIRNVWVINPAGFPKAHFATFPPALVEPCIKAGTSEHGCCPRCGAPWERVVEKERTFESGSGKAGHLPIGKNGPGLQGGGATVDIRRGPVVHATTTGWRPTCACPEHEPVPCVVLDPFAGAGTTLLVADRLGRRGVGVELSHEYCRMAWERCYEDAPLLAWAERELT